MPFVNSQSPAFDSGTATATRPVDAIWECDICGTVMLDLHCKLRCTNCGFMRDCSDP